MAVGPLSGTAGAAGDGSRDDGTGAAAVDGTDHRLVVGVEDVPEGLEPGDRYRNATVVSVDDVIDIVAVNASDPTGFADRAREDPDVRYVEPDLPVHEAGDPRSSHQYGPSQIHVPDAHKKSDEDGGDVAVCVIDTGVRYTHEDLSSGWQDGIDTVDDDGNPWDPDGHGTHVAGIAAARFGNGKGIHGTSLADIYGVRAVPGRASDLAEGIRWCADNTGTSPTVISMSLSFSEQDERPLDSTPDAVADAIDHAHDVRGNLLVAAAGNKGRWCNQDCVTTPARHPDVIAVACTDSSETRCSFSSPGPQVELAAPGSSIHSTCNGSDSAYCDMSGTSMGAPFVTGVAALLWSEHPTWGNGQVRDRLRGSAQDLGPDGRDEDFGFGEADALCTVLRKPYSCAGKNVVASHLPRIQSTGWFDDQGTLVSFDLASASGPVEVTYRYCYHARTNGRPAHVRTYFDGQLVDDHGFRHPYTGGGGCDRQDPSTYDVRTFTVDKDVHEQIRFDFENGDFRLVVSDIVVRSKGEDMVARQDGAVSSTGNAKDVGRLFSLVGLEGGDEPVRVSYRYCYHAQSAGRTAHIWTYFDGQLVDGHGFRTPACSSVEGGALRSFVVDEPVTSSVTFRFKNGDWRVVISDVRVEQCPDVSPLVPTGCGF